MSSQAGPYAANLVAAIVTMEPDAGVLRHVEALLSQAALVVVVDNGSKPAAGALLDELARRPSVRVIRNEVNRGIATALNQAARLAIDSGAIWLLTLDQDAEPGPDIVAVAAATYAACPFSGRLAVIGSTALGAAARDGAEAREAPAWVECSAVITAGSFVSLAAFIELGGFRDDLFVDYVDIEYCLRARAHGLRIVRSNTPAMVHEVGQPAARRLGPRLVHPTNHTARRRYYITRNRLLVWRRFARSDGRFVARDILASQKELIKLLLFEQDRPAKIRAMLSGFADAVRGTTGERGRPRS